MRVTFADLQNSRVPAALGVCATDPRLLQWANEAMERMIQSGKFFGTYGKFRICSTNSCVTLPRQIATIEKLKVCGRPVRNHDMWFEFLESHAPTFAADSCWPSAQAQGYFPTFKDITGLTSKLNFICDVLEDVGQKVLVLGYDQNGNWLRTQQAGVWADGEVITLAQSPGTQSVNLFSAVTDIQFPAMNGQSWLYQYDTSTNAQTLIGHYQYDETRPHYARYLMPGITQLARTTNCGAITIEAACKLEFIPVKVPADYLIPPSIPAFKEMMVAIKDAEDEADPIKRMTIYKAGLESAKATLDNQLGHYLGDGREIGIEIRSYASGSNDPIPTFL